jgi:DNA-binding response OmpR family regulator
MKVLLVEDDTFFREFYAKKLKEKNLEVQTAVDGDIALEILKVIKPDIVLLDIIMPKKDGFDVLKGMAEKKLLPGTPVLVFSTLGQESDIEKARLLGARGYVNKSFYDFEKLYSQILAVTGK